MCEIKCQAFFMRKLRKLISMPEKSDFHIASSRKAPKSCFRANFKLICRFLSARFCEPVNAHNSNPFPPDLNYLKRLSILISDFNTFKAFFMLFGGCYKLTCFNRLTAYISSLTGEIYENLWEVRIRVSLHTVLGKLGKMFCETPPGVRC